MSTYQIKLQGDILKVGFGSTLATGDRIVRDVAAQLDEMISLGELPGGSLIKINGRVSVLASQVLGDKLGKLYDAIALLDPKIGEPGIDRYVVTISRHPNYQVGDILDVVRDSNSEANLKVVLCGFANTGKTCFRDGLKQALLQIPNAPESYFISGCPDGDGSWYSETARRDPDLAAQLKAQYKAGFTAEFINSVNDIKQKSSILRNSLQTQVARTPFKYLKNILEKFVKKFSRSSVKESEYQLELSGWYFDNHRYSTGYITLAESIITYLCEINGKDIRSETDRGDMKNFLHRPENKNSDLARLYFDVNPIRKSIAHALLDTSSGNDRGSLSNAINNAKTYQQIARRIFSTGTLNQG